MVEEAQGWENLQCTGGRLMIILCKKGLRDIRYCAGGGQIHRDEHYIQ